MIETDLRNAPHIADLKFQSNKTITTELNLKKTVVSTTKSIFYQTQEPDVKLRKIIYEANKNQLIRNKHFILNLLKESNNPENPKNSSNTIYEAPKFLVILVQIHSRLVYFKELVESLRNTKHISESLVIFSHDVYFEKMNELIADIDFCATLQIFYPYSLQLYKNEFPGTEPNDCEKSMTKEQAIKVGCNNAYHSDSFGHYREAKVVQIKHHWLWKLGYVFEKVTDLKNIKDLQVLLLEEDYYLMPDAIHVLRKLSEKIKSDIDVVSLAHIVKLQQDLTFKKLNKYAKAIWHTNHHNTGLMLGRTQWIMFKDCLNAFCTYDDYNWDWTLQYMSQKCFKLPLVSIYPSSSRVIHIGQCGTHYKGKNCDPKESVDNLKKSYIKQETKFFPKVLNFDKVDTLIRHMKKPNGGWADPRDHQLCKSFLQTDSVNLVNITIKA